MTQLSGKTAEKSLAEIMSGIGSRARSAAQTLALAGTEEKNTGLQNAANELRAAAGDIIEANRHDLAEAEKQSVRMRLKRLLPCPIRSGQYLPAGRCLQALTLPACGCRWVLPV